jgi:UDP-glucose:(heptosyl)LPS alpha-1,3-glucosyltransferase
MRICLSHMRQARTGGTEQYLNLLAHYLCERGHEVTILCRSREGSPHQNIRFEILHDFALGPAWRRWTFARAVERHLMQHVYDVVVGLGKTWSQDVVRLGGGCHQSLMSMVSSHEARRVSLNDRVALEIERRAFMPGAFRRVIANSYMVKADVVRRYGVAEDKIQVIHNGVDTCRFVPERHNGKALRIRQQAGFRSDHHVFLFLGSSFQRKGLDLLLDAFVQVRAKFANARLLIAGRDSSWRRYAARAEELGISHDAYFLGHTSNPEACYNASDVYVLPTRYDSFGFSVLEALACGLPVITTTTCGAAELVRPGLHGSVIDTERARSMVISDLANAMLEWSIPGRAKAALVPARRLAEDQDIQRKLSVAEQLLLSVADEKRQERMSCPR